MNELRFLNLSSLFLGNNNRQSALTEKNKKEVKKNSISNYLKLILHNNVQSLLTKVSLVASNYNNSSATTSIASLLKIRCKNIR